MAFCSDEKADMMFLNFTPDQHIINDCVIVSADLNQLIIQPLNKSGDFMVCYVNEKMVIKFDIMSLNLKSDQDIIHDYIATPLFVQKNFRLEIEKDELKWSK